MSRRNTFTIRAYFEHQQCIATEKTGIRYISEDIYQKNAPLIAIFLMYTD